jgi:hypothetical protein
MRVAIQLPAGALCRVRYSRGRVRNVRTYASPNPPFDAYEVLGVNDDAKEAELKGARKALSGGTTRIAGLRLMPRSPRISTARTISSPTSPRASSSTMR